MEQNFSDLYARDSSGRIKVWKIRVNSVDNEAGITINHGLFNGKLEQDYVPVTTGKNIGRSNETNAYTQAISDAEGRWNHKKREGYKSIEDLGLTKYSISGNTSVDQMYVMADLTYTLGEVLELTLPKDNTDKDGNLKPMKCQPFTVKKLTKILPAIGQPKLNGFRCVARYEEETIGLLTEKVVTFRSKEGLRYNLPHIAKEMEVLFAQQPNFVFDGEMYAHGLSLQTIASAVKKANANTHRIQFHIFDLSMPDMSQQERIRQLEILHEDFAKLYSVVKVKHDLIHNDTEAQEFCDECIKEGFEGAVFRATFANYEFGKRPSTILKLKRSSDAEFEILDVVLPEDKNPEYSVLLCKNDKNDLTFKATIQGSLPYRKALYETRDVLKGTLATIRFFERTEDKIPFHATVIAIRDYE